MCEIQAFVHRHTSYMAIVGSPGGWFRYYVDWASLASLWDRTTGLQHPSHRPLSNVTPRGYTPYERLSYGMTSNPAKASWLTFTPGGMAE